jgi:hypothetical protein
VIYIVTIACGRRRRQEADLMHDNFCAIPALSGLPILPGASAEGALDVDPRALLDIVPKDLAYPLVTDEVVPFGAFLPFPAAIFETVAGSQREIDQGSARQDVDLRILSGMAQQRNSIKAFAHTLLLPISLGCVHL